MSQFKSLKDIGIIREVDYSTWLSNVVLIPKSYGASRICNAFTYANETCPTNFYPLHSIDQLVDGTIGYDIMNFLDAYSSYHQIHMSVKDKEKMTFIIKDGTFCY